MSTEFANIPLARIASSLTNPRKHFDPAKLDELAHDIKRRGIDTPITVRPLPGKRVGDTERGVEFELVCGERRLRASQLAGVATIPAMVRALTDNEALEIQLCENLKRDDLSALEEAEGYDTLMQHSEINADELGERIGKSRSYVYGRLKLLDLCPEARTSLRSGEVDASRALVVARIPDSKLQIKAMKEIVQGPSHVYGGAGEPMTYREALDHVQRNYMLKLSEAKFKITALDLVPAAGSCKDCTKRTGHNPDLFSDVKGADVCTDPPCFHKKEEAHSAQVVAAAQAKGQTVIAGKEAAELRGNSYHDKFKGYRRLDSAEDSPTDQPLRKILAKVMEAEGIIPVAIEHPSRAGELVECLTNEVALKLLKMVEAQAKGEPKVSKEVQQLVDDKKAKADAKAKAAFEQGWRDDLVAHTWGAMERIDSVDMEFSIQLHRYLLLKAVHNLSAEQAGSVAKLLDLDKIGAASAIIEVAGKTDTPAKLHALAGKTDTPAKLHALVIMVRDSSANDFSYSGGSKRTANEGLHLVAQAVLGSEINSTLKDIQAAALAKHFPKVVQTAAEKCAPAPAARAEGSGEDAKDKGAARPKLRAPRPRPGAEEVLQGIAAAMQAEEAQAASGLEESLGADAQGNEGGADSRPTGADGAAPDEPAGDADGQAEPYGNADLDMHQLNAARDLVIRTGKATVRHLKTEMRVGHDKARELLDKLEAEGVVSACNERGAREVLVGGAAA